MKRNIFAKVMRRNKYGAKTATYNGYTYHSQKEAAYAAELDLRVRAKEIKSWRRQVSFRLPRHGKKVCSIVVDFVVTMKDGSEKIEEVKGFASPEWRVKWGWLETDYPEIEKVVIW